MDYKIWKPEHDGHAPPNWREGMWWDIAVQEVDGFPPKWNYGLKYIIPAEALNSPNDDVFAALAPQQWFDQDSIDPIAATVAQLRQYPAEELAKHGITLAPEKDWATELWADIWEARGSPVDAELVRNGQSSIADCAAIELLRTRFEQMIAERSKRDA